MEAPSIALSINGIEVIYNHVILVLKGVSLQVPDGRIVALPPRQVAPNPVAARFFIRLTSCKRAG